MSQFSVPFLPPPHDASALKPRLHGFDSAQKIRYFWRERNMMELANGTIAPPCCLCCGTEQAGTRGVVACFPYDIAESRTGGANRVYGKARVQQPRGTTTWLGKRILRHIWVRRNARGLLRLCGHGLRIGHPRSMTFRYVPPNPEGWVVQAPGEVPDRLVCG